MCDGGEAAAAKMPAMLPTPTIAGIIHCPTSLRGGDVRLVGVITSCVGIIVSGILASGVLVVGSVIRSSLALGAESVIGHHSVLVFVHDCRAIKKPRQITSATISMVGVTGIEPMTPPV